MRLVLALLMCWGVAFAQDTTKYFKSVDYGWNWQRGKFRSGLILPTDTTNNKLGIAQIGATCFAWSGVKWNPIGSTDTAFLVRYYRKNQVDSAILANTPVPFDSTSLSNRINLRVKYTDTAAMLNPYLRKVDTASLSNRINLKLNATDTASLSNRINAKGNGTVTSIIAGNGLGGGTITTSGTITNNLITGVSGGQTAYGGTASADNLTIQSTTNATQGNIYLNPLAAGNTNTNGGVYLGKATADPLPISGDPNHLFGIINDSTNKQMFSMWAFGSGSTFQNNMHFYRANGTIASPRTIAVNQFLLSMGFRGYDGNAMSQSAAAYQVLTPSTWTTSNHETRFQWEVTPNGSVVRTRAMQLNGDGSIFLTPNSTLTPYRTTTQFVLDGAASGYTGDFRALLQSTSTNGAGIILGESTSSESYLVRYGSSYSGNFSNTSIPFAATLNLRSGGTSNLQTVIGGTPIINIVGNTATNIGTRIDAAGVRIDQIQNLHTSNRTSAALEIVSITKGLLFPRTLRASVTSPVAGLVIYDTFLNKLCVYNGTAWETITSL
jgi:hypothetical protein